MNGGPSSESRLRVLRLGLKSALEALRTGRVDFASEFVQQSLAILDREIECATAAAKKPEAS
jgi:hypothetical protein